MKDVLETLNTLDMDVLNHIHKTLADRVRSDFCQYKDRRAVQRVVAHTAAKDIWSLGLCITNGLPTRDLDKILMLSQNKDKTGDADSSISSLREDVIPNEWKMANVIPLPKSKLMISVETNIRPISLTPNVAKVFESIVLGWVDDVVGDRIDDNQFGGVGGTSITDDLVEMTHKWYEATDVLNNYVRVVLLDFSKAFDLINHHILLDKLITNGVPAHIVRWLAAFLLDRQQQVKIGNIYSRTGSPNGGVPQGTLSGPKCFLLYINDLETHVPLFKYVDDSTLFEILCNINEISEIKTLLDDI